MDIIFGTGLHGRVDIVPGLCHAGRLRGCLFLGTQFFHIAAFPLVPLRSYVVVASPGVTEDLGLMVGTSQPLVTVRVPLSLKSVVFGYLRAALVGFGLACLVLALMLFGRGGEFALLGFVMVVLAALAGVAVWQSYTFVGAGMGRAEELKGLVSQLGVTFTDPAPIVEH